MQLSPDTTALFAVLSDFPFAFTKTFQPGGINHRCAISRVNVLKLTLTDFARLLTLVLNPGSITERSSGQNGINKTLRGPPRVSRNTRLITRTVVMARSE